MIRTTNPAQHILARAILLDTTFDIYLYPLSNLAASHNLLGPSIHWLFK